LNLANKLANKAPERQPRLQASPETLAWERTGQANSIVLAETMRLLPLFSFSLADHREETFLGGSRIGGLFSGGGFTGGFFGSFGGSLLGDLTTLIVICSCQFSSHSKG
jgi:hypothetical protein